MVMNTLAVKGPFHRGYLSDSLHIIHLHTTHNSSKLHLRSSNKKQLYVWGSPQPEELYEQITALRRLRTNGLDCSFSLLA